MLIGVPGLGGIKVPLQLAGDCIEELGPGLSHHVMGHGLAQDLGHHGQVLPVVMGLEQCMTLKRRRSTFSLLLI
jgi:hypothetical protein